MNVIGAIRRIILDDIAAPQSASLGGRVYPVVVAQAQALPSVCLGLIDVGPIDRKTGVSDMDFVAISVNTFSLDYYQANQIDAAIRDVIDGYSGSVTTTEDSVVHNIQNISFLSTLDSYSDEQKIYVRETRYRVSYRRNSVPLPEGSAIVPGTEAWLSTWPTYDSHEDAEAAGVTYYRASANHRAHHGTLFFKGLSGAWDYTEDNGNYSRFTAGQNLSSGRLVIISGGQAYYFQPGNTAHAGRAYGITTTSATAGGTVTIVTNGEVEDAAFGFAADKTLWVTTDGEIVDTYPALAVAQKAGISIGADRMVLDLSIQAIT